MLASFTGIGTDAFGFIASVAPARFDKKDVDIFAKILKIRLSLRRAGKQALTST